MIRAVTWTLLTLIVLSAGSGEGRAGGAIPDSDLSKDFEARGFAEMMFGQGRLAWEDGNLAGALSLFDRASATWPGDATYIYFSGLVEIKMGRPDRAVKKIAGALPPAESRIAEWRVRSDLGTAHYLNGEAAEAEKELRQALAIEPRDAITRFTLGLALLDLGRTSEARKELEAAGAEDPKLATSAHYYGGVAAFRQGDASQARSEFRKVIVGLGESSGQPGEARPDADLVRDARGFLGASEGQPGGGGPRAELRASAVWEYDSNPAIISEDLAPFLQPAQRIPGDDRLALALRGELHPFYDWHGLSAGFLFSGYRSQYNDVKGFDQLTPQGLVQLSWGRDPRGYVNGPLGYVRVPAGRPRLLSVVFQGGSSYTWLDDRSFGRAHVAAVGLVAPWGEFTSTQLDLLYESRTYFRDLEGWSNDTRTVRLSEYVSFGRPERYLRVGYGIADQDADGTLNPLTSRFDHRMFDNEQKSWFADVSLPLPAGLALFLEGSRTRTDFDTLFPVAAFFTAVPRVDTESRVGATVVAPLGSRFYLTGRYSHVRRDTEVRGFGYVREITSFGVTWHW